MKSFLFYLRQRRRRLAVNLLFCAIFAGTFALFRLPVRAVLYALLICLLVGFFLVSADYRRVLKKHRQLERIRSMADAAPENFPPADCAEDSDYQQIIRLLREEQFAFRTETGKRYENMVDYYTIWAHQIKTPIASMRLHLQNEDSPLSRKLSSDLFRIEQYADMVLTFLRLDSDSTDYVFREYDLDKIVKSAVKKFSSEFIGRKLSLVYEPLNTTVVTDEKWLSFVIEQVLSNALKYTPSGSITISLAGGKTLRIEDTGIGIAPEDLPRIFENGYTGYNGRTDRKASGIGLYLCRRICTNLGHTITASSTVDVGTVIDIDLSQRKPETE